MTRSALSLALALLAPVLLLPVSGCGDNGQPALYPVRGKVTYRGKPAHRALVWFQPEGKTDPKLPRPHATVEKDGSFQVSTYNTHDGAPPGRYRVAMIWNAPGKYSSDDVGPSLLPARYLDPKRSGLPIVEVKEAPTELAPFALTH